MKESYAEFSCRCCQRKSGSPDLRKDVDLAAQLRTERLELRHLLKDGRTSLMIGLLFLGTCLLMSELLRRQEPRSVLMIARQGLIIAGWVAMWRPMEIFLHEWWPLLRKGRLYQKLSRMDVEVRKRA